MYQTKTSVLDTTTEDNTDVFDSHLSCDDLLQGVLTFDVSVIPHDDHDDWHEFVHQGQRTMFQLPSQDSLRMHVGDLLDFLHPVMNTNRNSDKTVYIFLAKSI